MLARTRLGDQAHLVHAFREQALPERVEDLVRTGMVAILTFEHEPRARAFRVQVAQGRQRRGASDVVAKHEPVLFPKSWIAERVVHSRLERAQRFDEDLRHEPAAEFAEITARRVAVHALNLRAAAAARTKPRTSSASLRPPRSTADRTSTAAGPTADIASPTFSAVRPPARMHGNGLRCAIRLARRTSTRKPVPPTRSPSRESMRIATARASRKNAAVGGVASRAR